jgi:hypothetical protein
MKNAAADKRTKRADPILVYLDTQDYSRFGDCLRGNAPEEIGRVFQELMALKNQGIARFVYSMPILSELLQYDPEYEATTLAKAKAVESLCEDYALLWPPRLVETQAASFARSIGLPLSAEPLGYVSPGNEWFPQISSAFMDLKQRWQEEIDGAVTAAGPLNRKQRRVVEAHKTGRKLMAATRAVSPAFAEIYGIPIKAVEGSVLLLLKGKISAEEASRRLFGAVAKPTAFVTAYFKIHEGDKSLPLWIRGLGESFERTLSEFRNSAGQTVRDERDARLLQSMLKADRSNLGTVVLRMIDTKEAEQGVTPSVLESIMASPEASSRIPACHVFGEIVLAYLDQTVGRVRAPAKIEKSFAGDLIHSLYIECVDIWRGDRRFAALVKERLPSMGHKVQQSLFELPDHIRSLAASRP